MSASSGRFTIDTQGDPIDFWTWLVHTLRADLGGPKKRSVLTQCFQVRLLLRLCVLGLSKHACPWVQSDIDRGCAAEACMRLHVFYCSQLAVARIRL